MPNVLDGPRRRGRPRKDSTTTESLEEGLEVTAEDTPVVDTSEDLGYAHTDVDRGTENRESGKLAELEAQVKLLTNALLMERTTKQAVNPEDNPTIGLVRTGGAMLSAHLTDAYGRKKHFLWPKVGHINYVTPAQLAELRDMPGGKKFFDRGFLAVESEVSQTRMDVRKFLDDLELTDIEDTIQEITDPAALLHIMNYIENERIVTMTTDGKPLLDADGKPFAEVRKVSHKLRLTAESVVARLFELTKVRYSLTDG